MNDLRAIITSPYNIIICVIGLIILFPIAVIWFLSHAGSALLRDMGRVSDTVGSIVGKWFEERLI